MAHHGLIITVIISPCGALLLVARVACILAFSSVRQFLGLLDMMSNLGRLATETDRSDAVDNDAGGVASGMASACLVRKGTAKSSEAMPGWPRRHER